ncbi:hypothetical protein [Ancylobacter mangrovi]|uniref:hypothetical protein n=1 Tax=Ancylobacter mangrovi TaxID=2972472 RepID=UPI002161610B|nr:hypothetical protein [Ancylobacter mangrovi]MCS0505161.1 hypothetical protein [Ancylobacter mangrovi]
MGEAEILIFGTGSFAARILFDLVAVATEPTRIVIAGRNADRLAWLTAAANARAGIFGTPATVLAERVDLLEGDAGATVIARHRPKVIVQAASPQASSVIAATGNRWASLIAQAGLSLTTVFQAFLSAKVASATAEASPASHFINCCYPDVANSVLKALGLPVTSGVGNVSILSSLFATSPAATGREVKVLAHYQTITPWRQPPPERRGPAPRVWIDDVEVEDVFATFRDVQLTREPVIDVSGAAGVPMMLAMAHGHDWRGHVPGPNGLPGGYPAAMRGGVLALDPPSGIDAEAAISWNAAFERRSGAFIDEGNWLRYAGTVRDCLASVSPALAEGFPVSALYDVHKEMTALRHRLEAQAA